MDKLRIGVIGCGGIFRWAHAPAYQKVPDRVEIVALCDIKIEKADAWKETFPGAETYEAYQDVIAREDIDAIDICLPNYLHAPVAIAALNAGKHVLCEKPDSVSVENVKAMKAASEAAGRVLMVMRNNRFVESAQYAKRYIEAGKAGDIYAGHCGWQRRRGIPGKGGWFTTKAQSGGGPLIDLGVHMIDLAIWLMGNPRPVSVTGSTYSKFSGSSLSDSENSAFGESNSEGIFDVEDLAMGFIKFDNGACLTIEFSWASNVEKERRFVQLYGDKAGINWDTEDLTIYTEEDGQLVDKKPLIANAVGGHEGYIRHFLDVVQKGAKPVFEPQQGVDMVGILTAIYESSRTGKEVLL